MYEHSGSKKHFAHRNERDSCKNHDDTLSWLRCRLFQISLKEEEISAKQPFSCFLAANLENYSQERASSVKLAK